MNLVALIGNLADEPELRYTPSGRAVCTFTLAVSRPGGDSADTFKIVAWERQAEVCNEYLTLGRRVGVEGRLHHTTFTAEDGKRSTVEVVAHRLELLGAARTAAAATVTEPEQAGVTA